MTPADLATASVESLLARTTDAREGLPVFDDRRVLDVSNVIWCTGFRQELSKIELPVIGEDGWPLHQSGVVPVVPSLHFMGLPFACSFTSWLIGSVGRGGGFVDP